MLKRFAMLVITLAVVSTILCAAFFISYGADPGAPSDPGNTGASESDDPDPRIPDSGDPSAAVVFPGK